MYVCSVYHLQVIEGGGLDINFKLLDPDSKVIYSDFRSMDGLHSFDIKHTGEYAMCFDNTFSRLSHKSVYFDIIIEDDEGNVYTYIVGQSTLVLVLKYTLVLHACIWKYMYLYFTYM